MKNINRICVLLMLLSASVWAYTQFFIQPTSASEYGISVWQLLTAFVARPLFFLCLGAVIAVLIKANSRKTYTICRVAFWAGIIVTVLYCCCAVAFFLSVSGADFSTVLHKLVKMPAVFVIPGASIGGGLSSDH